MPSPKHVFISSGRDNSSFAHHLAALMTDRGVEVFLDENVEVGDLWSETLRREIEIASALVLVLPSDTMSNRNNIWFEAGAAKALQKRVLGVLPPGSRLVDLPGDIADILVLDAERRSLDSIVETLVQAIPDHAA